MFPISVSDIFKILEKKPVWKMLTIFSRRVDALEEHATELCFQTKNPNEKQISNSPECTLCGGEMQVVKESPHEYLGIIGYKIHFMKCSVCAYNTSRLYTPRKGYDASMD